MNGSSLGFVVEALVAALLVVTIGYCVIVNRKLEQLRSDKSDLRAVVRDLYAATGHAEQALANLRQTSGSIEETLGDQTDRAEKAQSLLAAGIERGEGLLSKLDVITQGRSALAPLHQMAAERSSKPLAGRAAAHELAPDLRHSKMGLGLLNAQRGKSYSQDDAAKDAA